MSTVHSNKTDAELRLLVLVEKKLADPKLPFELTVQDVVTDHDGWVHFVVTPTDSNVRAYDYAELLSKIEMELRKDGVAKVLLVPAMPD